MSVKRNKFVAQVCEVCFMDKARSLTHCRNDNKWYFCCGQCLTDGYDIAFNRIGELDWYDHMMKKQWIHEDSFTKRFSWLFNNLIRVSTPEETAVKTKICLSLDNLDAKLPDSP